MCNPCHLLPYRLRKTQSLVEGAIFPLPCPSLSRTPEWAPPAPTLFYSPSHLGKLQVLICFQIYASLSCSQSVRIAFLSINPFPLIWSAGPLFILQAKTDFRCSSRNHLGSHFQIKERVLSSHMQSIQWVLLTTSSSIRFERLPTFNSEHFGIGIKDYRLPPNQGIKTIICSKHAFI